MARKVLFVFNEAYFFYWHRLKLAQAVQTAGYEVHIAAPNDHVWAPDGFSVEVFRDLGFHFHPIPLSRRGTNPFVDAWTLLALFRLMRALSPDLVHFATIKPNLYGGIAARLARVKSVAYSITGLGQVFIARGVRAWATRTYVSMLLRVAFRHPNCRIIFLNPDDRDRLISLGVADPARSRIISGEGVDLKVHTPREEPSGVPVVLLCARLIWEKGVGDFVDAARLLRNDGVHARFALVGETRPANPRSVPKSTIEGWVKEGVVEWWGYRSDIETVLAEGNVVCLPSKYGEGVPRILQEAAASGRAVVATNIPGCRDAVQDGVTGFLIPAGNVEALADRLRSLITDIPLRRKLGHAGRRRAEAAFGQGEVVHATLRVYQETGWRAEMTATP